MKDSSAVADEPSTTTPLQRLRRWSRAFDPIVVIAALLPLGPIIADEDPTSGTGVLLALGSWLVFAIDFGVRTWLGDEFLATWKGRLYLVIVIVTFPIYLLVPGLEEADLLALSRLGWVAVLAVAGVESARDLRRLVGRLGTAGLCAAAAVFVAALVVFRVEDAEDGFGSFGDGLWWAISTITTVGYGDRVPSTGQGRFVATLLMVSGLAFLGVIAASLASFFGLGDADRDDATPAPDDHRYDLLLDEVRALRADIARLRSDRDAGGEPSSAG